MRYKKNSKITKISEALILCIIDIFIITYIIMYNPYRNGSALTIIMLLGSVFILFCQYKSANKEFITCIINISIAILTLTSLIRMIL